MNIGSSWSAISLAAIPGTKNSESQIPERNLGGNVEAQMDAEDASKSLLWFYFLLAFITVSADRHCFVQNYVIEEQVG
jgi:hypothetical protein